MARTRLAPRLKIVVLLIAVVVSATFMTLFERRVIAWAQGMRAGPIRLGAHGSLQSVVDALQLLRGGEARRPERPGSARVASFGVCRARAPAARRHHAARGRPMGLRPRTDGLA